MAKVELTDALFRDIINASQNQAEVSAYIQKTGKEPLEAQREVAQLVANTFYNPDGSKKNYERMDKRAGKPLAKFLEKVGLREEGATYPVGGTPKRRKRAA